jgi:hypothetical protein
MRSTAICCALLAAACAHAPLSPSALDDTKAVAIVVRVADEAGPHATVFRDDATWKPQLAPKKIDDAEADRRLGSAITNGTYEKDKDGGKKLTAHTLTRFELADSLRSQLLDLLPRERPWAGSVNPADVASALESFLVHEVPSPPPDYTRLLDLGVDTVLEIVIEDYGMHADKGRAGIYLVGTARLFHIKGGELYHRKFFSDELTAGLEGLDPFAVARNAGLFAERLKNIVTAIGQQVASDLTSGQPRRSAPTTGGEDVKAPKRAKGDAAPAADDSL